MRSAMGMVIIGMLALVLASCGGSDENDAVGGRGTLSPQKTFIRAANAACTRAARGLLDPSSPDRVRYVETVVAWQHRKIDAMSQVEPPPMLRQAFDRYIGAMQARAKVFDRYLTIIRPGREPGKIDNTAGTMFANEKRQAVKLGLGTDCKL